MKKFLFSLAALAALTLSSCGGNATAEGEEGAAIDSLTVLIEDGLNAVSDSASAVDIIGKAKATIEELTAKGDTAAVKAYKWKLKKIFDDNKAKLETMNIGSLINEVANVEDLAKTVKDAAVADAEVAKDELVDATKDAIESNEKVQEAKAAVEETQKKVEEAKQTAEEVKKSAEEIKAAAQNAKNALSNLKKN
jgi:chromosome segregation ATPase